MSKDLDNQLHWRFVNDWAHHYYGASLIMIAWLNLDEYFSFSFIVLGIGFTIHRGDL